MNELITEREPSGIRRHSSGVSGFTLIEMMVITAIVGTLASIAVPRYHSLRDQANNARAAGDIRALEIDIAAYRAGLNSLPPDMAAIGRGSMLDPWGRPYQYLVIGSGGTPRQDQFLVQLNSDYDLFSLGVDGATAPPLSSAQGRDDVVRANDGGYAGFAARY